MSVFAAKYPGTCPGCHERIHVGDAVTFVDQTLMHEECSAGDFAVGDVDSLRPVREVCQRCWMEKSVGGACGCD